MMLTQANAQWSTRPADERFWTVADAKAARSDTKARSIDVDRPIVDLRAEAVDGDVRIVSRKGNPAQLTHHAFGQLANIAGAPAQYLRRLPATLAAQNLNHGLKALGETTDQVSLMLQRNASDASALTLRALTSVKYTRIWDTEFLDLCTRLEHQGWRAPPARPSPAAAEGPTRLATEADVLQTRQLKGLSVQVGDVIAPAGIYVGDRDAFVFLIDDRKMVSDGFRGGLARGVFLWNSEVGARSVGAMWFYFDTICGNHYVHGVSGVQQVRFSHVGSVATRWAAASKRIHSEAANYDPRGLETFLAKCRALTIAPTKTETIDTVAEVARAKRLPLLTASLLTEAYDAAAKRTEDYGAPNTAWGLVSGLTQVSQLRGHADDRVEIDRAAGKLAAILVG